MDLVRSDGGSLFWKTIACVSAMALASAMLLPGAASAQEREEGGEGSLLRAGNGPGPAANGPGPGCNIVPPLASIGTKVDISQFPPPDSLTNPALAGPVQLLKSGKFDIPIEQLTGINVPAGNPRGTITLPLYKGAVNTPSGLRPAWYIILDAGDQAEAERLGVNFSKKLHNAGDAARTATRRADGTFLFDSVSWTSVRTARSWPALRRSPSHPASHSLARSAMRIIARWCSSTASFTTRPLSPLL